MDEPTDIETNLVDLADYTVDEIRNMQPKHLAPYTDQLLRQVERPRVNVGGTDPPGRAD